MNPHNLSADQREAVACVSRLSGGVLRALCAPFTARFLEEAAVQAYVGTTARPAPEDDAEGVDWGDPSNVAFVVLETLKRYHVKHEIAAEPAAGTGEATLLILAARAEGERYPALLGVVRGGGDGELTVDFADGTRRAVRPADGAVETCVVLRRTRYTAEPGYAENRGRERLRRGAGLLALPLAVAVGAVAVLEGARTAGWLLWAPFLALWGAGLAVSYHLFLLDRGNRYRSELLQRFCSDAERGLSCRAVLSSSASRVLGGVSLTDVGAVYFATLLAYALVGLLTGRYPAHLPLLFWCAVAPVPLSLYLVHHQAAVVKRLCVLCMATHALLLAQLAVFLAVRPRIAVFAVDLPAVAMLAMAAGAVTLAYALGVRAWGLRARVAALSAEGERARRDPEHFALLARREPAFADTALPGALLLGSPGAPLRLSAILSPSCGPCGERLEALGRMVDWFDGDLGVTVLIKADELTQDVVTEVLHHTLAGDHDRAAAFLADLYGRVAAERENGGRLHLDAIMDAVRERHGSRAPHPGAEAARAAHREWFARQRVPHTPMLVFEHRALPQPYWETHALIDVLEQLREREAVHA